jgi:hypothetical protein
LPFDSTSYLLGAAIVTAAIAASLARSNYKAQRTASRPLSATRRLSALRREAREMLFAQMESQGCSDVARVRDLTDFVDPMSASCLEALLATPPGFYVYANQLVLLESYFENKDGSCTHVSVTDAFGLYSASLKVPISALTALAADAALAP